MKIVMLGLSITSSWGNGHATTYRSLIRGLSHRGHQVIFLERDVPWYASNRDCERPPYCQVGLYKNLTDLRQNWAHTVQSADAVIVGSYTPEGQACGDFVLRTAQGIRAFYDIDTPVTLAQLKAGSCEYLAPEQIRRYDLYLSFTGGPLLQELSDRYGAAPKPFYCSVDESLYYPERRSAEFLDLGYLGTYSSDRQHKLDTLLLETARRWPAGRFAVFGPLYPADLHWPSNVSRRDHCSPVEHRGFYCAQRFTLNVTRADMTQTGYSPSVRLFEAAACGTPIISDWWPGLDQFFEPGREIYVAQSTRDVLSILRYASDAERRTVGERARARVLQHHTGERRAGELEAALGCLVTT